MLRFKRFLYEALDIGRQKLAGSGDTGKRHIAKYIAPHYNAAEPTHTLATKHGDIPAGAQVTVHDTFQNEKGKYHATVTHNGKVTNVPISKIHKPITSYSYNDEHAFKELWNHGVMHGSVKSADKLREEIQKARTDKKHPLHFDNVGTGGFQGGKKTEQHKEAYYSELHDAVDSITSAANHKDFKKAVAEKHLAKVMGGERGEITEHWKKHGATGQGAVSKADVAIGKENEEHNGILMSMKKGGGSQLASPAPAEAHAMHNWAAKTMLDEHPMYAKLNDREKKKISDDIHNKFSSIRDIMENARTQTRDEKKKGVTEANKLMDELHDTYPHLNEHLRREAMTGHGKFGEGSAHAASHILVGGQGKNAASIRHVRDVDHSGSRAFISLGKLGKETDPLVMRLLS
jgi:uncharacterized protein with PIN domain